MRRTERQGGPCRCSRTRTTSTAWPKGWSLLGLFHLTKCNFGASEEAWENAAAHAFAAGNHRERLQSLSWVPLVVWAGRMPVKAAIGRCKDVLDRAEGDREAMSAALFSWGISRRCAAIRRVAAVDYAGEVRAQGSRTDRVERGTSYGDERAGRALGGRRSSRRARASLGRERLFSARASSHGCRRLPASSPMLSTFKAGTRKPKRSFSWARGSPGATTHIRKACCDAFGRDFRPGGRWGGSCPYSPEGSRDRRADGLFFFLQSFVLDGLGEVLHIVGLARGSRCGASGRCSPVRAKGLRRRCTTGSRATKEASGPMRPRAHAPGCLRPVLCQTCSNPTDCFGLT